MAYQRPFWFLQCLLAQSYNLHRFRDVSLVSVSTHPWTPFSGRAIAGFACRGDVDLISDSAVLPQICLARRTTVFALSSLIKSVTWLSDS